MKDPFMTLEGLAFQSHDTDIQRDINIKKAMQHIRAYCLDGKDRDLAMIGLALIEDRFAKVERFCDDIRSTFALDDFMDEDQKKAICARAYNNLVSRLTGRPVR